jgi:FkbM family methyltransferase
MSINQGLELYFAVSGIRGVLAISAYRLFGRPKQIRVHPPGIRKPVHLRVRTSDVLVYAAILLREEYKFELPFSPKVIVDAGANIGMTSIFFANRYPGAKIIAIEPETSNFSALVRNVRPYPAILPIQAALWNRDGEISLSEPNPSTGAEGKWGYVTHEGAGVMVPAMTMRTLMKKLDISFIDLLKIDIEGSEKEVFDNCDWVDKINSLVIELHDWCRAGCSDAVDAAMLGFSKDQRGEATFYVRNDRSPVSV